MPIIRHDINKQKLSNIFKKSRIIKEIAYYCSAKKLTIDQLSKDRQVGLRVLREDIQILGVDRLVL